MHHSSSNTSRAALERIVERVGHLLPAQGPIQVFVHHNTLHAFEHLSFHDAVVEAGRLYGCAPYLTEDRYRDELRRGRIGDADITAVLEADLGGRRDELVFGSTTRLELSRLLVAHGIPEHTGWALQWELDETDALERARVDMPAEARERAGLPSTRDPSDSETARYVRALWSACQRAAERCEASSPRRDARPERLRDLVLASLDIDIDEWVHPLLTRVTGAFLDQGLADWPMPGRERGLLPCFLELYSRPLARLGGPLGVTLQPLVKRELEARRDGWTSLERSLEQLGLPPETWEEFLEGEALALRGFAGMVYQFERRPDRVPVYPAPARLVDFLSVRLLLVRAALTRAATSVGFNGSLAELRSWLSQSPRAPTPSSHERAWALFHVAQLTGLTAANVQDLDARALERVEAVLSELDSIERRRVLHCAYERHLRHRLFDALTRHHPPSSSAPAFQAAFCIDDREESIRRHLEEVEPEVETFGLAGFYGVAMHYRGINDAHARPLCPVAIRPRHYVAELGEATTPALRRRLLRQWERARARFDENVHTGSRHARRGAVLFVVLGALWVIPLLLRVVFPWLHRALGRSYEGLQSGGGRLAIEYQPGERPPVGEQVGFTPQEMAEIVFSQLSVIGIRDRFAALVLIIGHGSTSLNNPQESAYNCGACGGGRGGANARAFAQMANLPEVRRLLAERGLCIPSETWFVGGERNTASNDVELYDVDLVPARVRPRLRRAVETLEIARRREAHERCRRFESASAGLSPRAALRHVEARSADLAQPRAECGHATNAFCVVGRRSRTRGLFLDRRAFLVSYDPLGDADGAQLERTLAAVVPVVAGINLEYFFGAVDPSGYGSGTKLPHNITALVGVMDGAQSDLRTGLPWQMLEIHEPVRLSIVVEAEVARVQALLSRSAELRRLVDHGWIYMAALDPNSSSIVELDAASVRPYTPERALQAIHGGSRRHYEGRRGHLPFVAIAPSTEEVA